MAPPKPSLKPSLMNSSACWRLPLKAWAMPGNLDSPQVLQDLVDRPANVQQHRQVELTGEFQLLDKIELLARRVAVGHVEVEADLADGHRLLAFQPVARSTVRSDSCACVK